MRRTLPWVGGMFVAAALSVMPIASACADDLVAAVLPLSRSARVGEPVSVFATVINTSGHAMTDCDVTLPSFDGDLSYQKTDPSTNAPVGDAFGSLDMAAGASTTLVLDLTPYTTLSASEQRFVFRCLGGAPALSFSGVDTLLLSADTAQPPDIVALALTPTRDGVLRMAGLNETQAFVVATVNVGTEFYGTVSLDTGDITLPLDVKICETDPATSVCVEPQSSTVTTTIAADATPTFAFFVSAQSPVPFYPASIRAFVRIKDQTGVVRGETSVALEASPSLSSGQTAGGIYSGTYRGTGGITVNSSGSTIVVVSEDGELRGVNLADDMTIAALLSSNVALQSDLTFAAAGSEEPVGGGGLPGDGGDGVFSLSGAVSPHQFIAGNYALNGESGALEASYFAPEYERPSSLKAVSGVWNLRTSTGDSGGSITVASNGSFTGKDYLGCLYSGKIAVIDSRYNAYRIDLTLSNCSSSSGSYDGLGVFFDTNSVNDSFQFLLTGKYNAWINYVTRF